VIYLFTVPTCDRQRDKRTAVL